VKGILDYGVCLPHYRIRRKTIQEAMGWFNPSLAGLAQGEKAVANHDQDSLALAVGAGMDALADLDRGRVEVLFLASTTLPYQERSNAAIAAAALDLPPEARTAEFSGDLKAGVSALVSALREDNPGLVVVAASDCRLGMAGGANETLFGDAAAALVVGDGDPVAVLRGHHVLTCDFADHRRAHGDAFVRSWEERWVREEGYTRFIPQVIKGLLEGCGLTPDQIARVIFPPGGGGGRDHGALAKLLGLNADQIQDPLTAAVGHSGAAHPLLMLAGALEAARPGDRIAMVGYGSGAEALLLEVTEALSGLKRRHKLQRDLAYRREMDSYPKYLAFKGAVRKEAGIRGEEIAPTSLSLTWRERDSVLRLAGGRCRACGTPQFPRERICVNPECGALDHMDDYPFSRLQARLFTYTADHLAYCEDPPQLYGIVDFDGGGRYWFDLTDCQLSSLQVGQPLAMTFRRKYQDPARGLYGYFWKAMPVKA
jgi:3-hydroxy-3-methylglutaryl CoA synthase